jgi:hypothetical protein
MKKKKKPLFLKFDDNVANIIRDCSSPIRDLICQLVDCSKIKCEKEKPRDDSHESSNGVLKDTQ